MLACGAKCPAGTVQAVNSLRGACIAQAVLAAQEFVLRFPHATIVESHPKASLLLLGLKPSKLTSHAAILRLLGPYVTFCKTCGRANEHVRDAALAALAANAALLRLAGWEDIAVDDQANPFKATEPTRFFVPTIANSRR